MPDSNTMQYGKPRTHPELRRSERLAIMLRPGEMADIRVIADAWGVQVGTAGWAIVATYLADARGEAPHLGDAGMVAALSRRMLEAMRSLPSDG